MARISLFLSSLFAFLFLVPVLEASTLKCLLVSIEKYQMAPLVFADNDVGQLSNILMQRYDSSAKVCIDTAAFGNETPRDSVMEVIESWCKTIEEKDTAILYLAGHGVKDEQGRLYLAMIDFNNKNFDTAAIDLAWIREQLVACSGKHKLLLIDTCFAGTEKNAGFAQATAGEVSDSFAKLENVVTIASCRANEKSWIWEEVKHSLFTYWLIEAFKGHADQDSDRHLTCDELVRYLEDNVPWSAQTALGQDQHPVVLNAGAGRHLKLPLRAVALSKLVDDIAEQVDLQMRLEKYPRIGIPEFTSSTPKYTGNAPQFDAAENESFNRQYGSLPRWVCDELRKTLARKVRKSRSYEILSENALREELNARGITPADLGTEKTRHLKVGGVDVPLLINGQFSLFGDAGLSIRACLLDTKGKCEVGHTGGAALLNSTELGMTSVSVNREKFSIASEAETETSDMVSLPHIGTVTPAQQSEAQQIRQAARQPHPMLDDSLPYKITFGVRPVDQPTADYQKRDVVISGNECYLPLSKGEQYRIVVDPGKENVFSRILVDGLNTLSQMETVVDKGAFVEAVGENEAPKIVVAPRASLETARHWWCEGGKLFAITGFYDANDKADTLHRFEIVDADQSVAARREYTDQLGTITVAFFQPWEGDKKGAGIGTGMGRQENVRIQIFQGNTEPGEMIAVYNFRYLTPEALKALNLSSVTYK